MPFDAGDLLTLIFEPVVHLIFSVPGGFIRWSISRFWGSKKPLKKFIKEDKLLNSLVTILVGIIIGLLIVNS